MKAVLFILCLGFLAVTASKEQDEELDLEQIVKDLEESPFVEINQDEADRKHRNAVRGYCHCIGENECECCAAPKVFNRTYKGCINFEYNNSEKKLNVSLDLGQHKPLSHEFPIGRLERMCHRLPGKAKFITLCLVTETTESEEQGLGSCTDLEVNILSATAARVSFKCVSLKNGQISFDDQAMSGGDASLIRIVVKNPLKVVIDFINKQKKNSKSKKIN